MHRGLHDTSQKDTIIKKNVLYICFFIHSVDISKNKLLPSKYDNNNT